LRERIEDVCELAEHFLKLTAKELQIEPKRLRPEAVALFERYDWPGNVRQLENACRRATIMAPAQEIDIEDLPPELGSNSTESEGRSDNWEAALTKWAVCHVRASDLPILNEAVPRFEQIMIRVALTHTQGRRQDAARLLGWGRNTLTRKIKELGIEM
jgi:two-component system nitrogen regulation response regulator GlnG